MYYERHYVQRQGEQRGKVNKMMNRKKRGNKNSIRRRGKQKSKRK